MSAGQIAHVAGVEGCPGGWVCVRLPLTEQGRADPAQAHGDLFEHFADLLAAHADARVIAVDIPIGLADRAIRGGRRCDIAARAVLGARQSAVFAMPSRDAVMSLDYRHACEIALATSEPPRKISKQAFNLFAKIREVDRLMSPKLQDRVREVHPEVAFWALNGERALETPKKVKSRPNPEGLEQRKQLLERVGFARSFLDAFSGAPQNPLAPRALYRLAVSLGELGQTDEACLTLTEVDLRYPGSVVAGDVAAERQVLACP